jgi:hypothetical protein
MKNLCLILSTLCILALPAPSPAATAEDYYKAGAGLYQQGKFDDAIKYLDAAIQLDPKHWQSQQARGFCLYRQGKKQEALDACEKSLAIHKDNPSLKQFAETLKAELATSPVLVPLPPSPAAPAKKKYSGPKEIKQDIYINPAGLIFGLAGVGYERAVGENKSFTVEGSFASHSLTGQNISMLGLGGSLRFWNGEEKLKGLFFGPDVSILSIHWSFDMSEFDMNTYQIVTTEETQSALFFSVGGLGGYQWIFSNHVMLNLGLTLNYMIGGFESKPGWPDFKYSGIAPGGMLDVGYAF